METPEKERRATKRGPLITQVYQQILQQKLKNNCRHLISVVKDVTVLANSVLTNLGPGPFIFQYAN